MSKAAILIVEDETIVATDLASKLGRLGYEISGRTARGEEAVTLARELRPDLVLMDIRLKGNMDGAEAAEVIRRECDLPVIYLTAYSDNATLERAKLSEPFGYILKPFEELDLETHIQMALYKHQAERKLRQSEARYRLLFDRNPDGVFAVDMAGRFVAANPACETISGYPVAELLQMTFMELCAPDQLAKTVEFFQWGLRGLDSLELETALLRKDGRRVELWIAGEPLPAAPKTIVHCTAKDITARKRAEEALSQNEARLRLAQSSAGAGVWDWDTGTGKLEWSDELFRLFGLEPGTADPSFDSWRSVIHPDDRLGAEQRIEAALRNHTALSSEYRIVLRSGEVRWISALGSTIYDNSGKPQRMSGICIDMTGRKRAEEGLRESRAKMKAAFASMTEAIFIADADGRLIEFNEEFVRYHRFKDREECSRTIADCPRYLEAYFQDGTPAPPELWAMARALRGETASDVEYMLRRKETGETWWGSYNFAPIKDEGGRIVGAVVAGREITARKRVEEHMRALTQRLTYHVDHSPLAVIEWGPDMRLTRWSGEAERVFGWKAEEVLGKRMEDFRWIYQEDEPQVAQVTGDLLTGANPRRFSANRNYRKDGSVVHCEWYNSSLVDASGKLLSILSLVLDVTARKQAEQELERMRNLLAEGQRVAHVGSFEYVAATRTTVWSEEEYRIYGLDPAGPSPSYDVMLGKCLHPEDAALLHQAFSAALQSHSVYELDHRIVRPDGSVRWVHDRALPYCDDSGRLLRYVGATLDITERKQAEQQLRQSREDLDRAQAVGQIGSWRLDTRRNILTWSDENHRIFGLPKGTPMSYETFLSTIHPDDRQYVDTQWQAGVRGAPYDIEHRIVVAGQVKWVREKAYLEFDTAGHLLGGFGITQDITARKRAETALRDSEKRVGAIVSSAMDAIVSVDADQRIVLFNAAAERMFGYRAQEAVGQSLNMLLPPDRRAAHDQHVRAFAATGVTARQMGALGEVAGLRANGEQFPIEASISQIEIDGHKLLTVILRDITERKRAAAELREAQAKLQAHAEELEATVARRTAKLQETVGDLEHFSYAITHDMRAPLRAMQGFASMLEEDCADSLNPIGRDYLRRIKLASDRLDRLITDSLNYGKTVRQELSLEPVSLRDLICGLVETYPNLQPDKADIEIAEGLPVVLGNQAALVQCFSNLLGNAVKFGKAGRKPRIRIWAELVDSAKLILDTSAPPSPAGRQPATINQQLVRIWVEDEGIGIPKDCQTRIFDLFQRATATHEGTGVGLAIVRKVVERMGGRAGVESEEGQGSRFWVELQRAG